MHSSATESDAEALVEAAGPAHVATVSFLAARAVPSAGFVVALAGGTALARVAYRRGWREGYGASIAAMVETVAIMGPARFGVPLTQAISAPLLGRMEATGRHVAAQVAAAGAVRVLSNAIGFAFFVWVIAGGLDAYAGSYDRIVGLFGLELGQGGTLAVSLAGLLFWGVMASVVQVLVYRRGLERWPERAPDAEPPPAEAEVVPGRFDPRAAAVAAAIGFGLLLASTSWELLGAVTGALALAWSLSRPDVRALPTGLVLGAILALGAFAFSLGGGLGLDVALRRALRAALLVAVATWLRAAARPQGLREVGRRALARLAWIPAATQAGRVLEAIGAEGRIAAAGRSLRDRLRDGPRDTLEVVDAVLAWVASEAGRFRSHPPRGPLLLRLGGGDLALLAVMAAPVLTLVG